MGKNNLNSYIFLLSGENINLAKEEVLALGNYTKYKLIEKLLIIDTKKSIDINKLSNRLAFTKSIHKLLFQCSRKDLINKLKNYDWNSVYKDDFCVRIINNKKIKNIVFNEKRIAEYAWRKIKNPKVNLDNPKTLITFFFSKDKVYCGLLLKAIPHDFDKRKPHLRPRPSPTSLHPKLARAMVNLTGIRDKSETIADLFCGSGGIPLEAGLMGFKTIANDINKKMLWKTLVNLRYYKIKDYKLMNKDILKIKEKFYYVASDLPYGLNSSVYFNKKNLPRMRVSKLTSSQIRANFFSEELENFYLKIAMKLKKIVKKRIILIFPHFINYKKLIKKSGLKLRHDFGIYVHKSLTRRIVVLEK